MHDVDTFNCDDIFTQWHQTCTRLWSHNQFKMQECTCMVQAFLQEPKGWSLVIGDSFHLVLLQGSSPSVCFLVGRWFSLFVLTWFLYFGLECPFGFLKFGAGIPWSGSESGCRFMFRITSMGFWLYSCMAGAFQNQTFWFSWCMLDVLKEENGGHPILLVPCGQRSAVGCWGVTRPNLSRFPSP